MQDKNVPNTLFFCKQDSQAFCRKGNGTVFVTQEATFFMDLGVPTGLYIYNIQYTINTKGYLDINQVSACLIILNKSINLVIKKNQQC